MESAAAALLRWQLVWSVLDVAVCRLPGWVHSCASWCGTCRRRVPPWVERVSRRRLGVTAMQLRPNWAQPSPQSPRCNVFLDACGSDLLRAFYCSSSPEARIGEGLQMRLNSKPTAPRLCTQHSANIGTLTGRLRPVSGRALAPVRAQPQQQTSTAAKDAVKDLTGNEVVVERVSNSGGSRKAFAKVRYLAACCIGTYTARLAARCKYEMNLF